MNSKDWSRTFLGSASSPRARDWIRTQQVRPFALGDRCYGIDRRLYITVGNPLNVHFGAQSTLEGRTHLHVAELSDDEVQVLDRFDLLVREVLQQQLRDLEPRESGLQTGTRLPRHLQRLAIDDFGKRLAVRLRDVEHGNRTEAYGLGCSALASVATVAGFPKERGRENLDRLLGLEHLPPHALPCSIASDAASVRPLHADQYLIAEAIGVKPGRNV